MALQARDRRMDLDSEDEYCVGLNKTFGLIRGKWVR